MTDDESKFREEVSSVMTTLGYVGGQTGAMSEVDQPARALGLDGSHLCELGGEFAKETIPTLAEIHGDGVGVGAVLMGGLSSAWEIGFLVGAYWQRERTLSNEVGLDFRPEDMV